LKTEGNRAGCKLDIYKLGAELECGLANSLEVFAADDALEGGASTECHLSDDYELIGQGNAIEGGTVLESAIANSFEFLLKTTRSRAEQVLNVCSSLTVSLSGRAILVRARHSWNAASPKFVMLLCSPNATLTRWLQLPNVRSGMLSSLGQPERSTRRRDGHKLKGWNSPHPIAVRLEHLN